MSGFSAAARAAAHTPEANRKRVASMRNTIRVKKRAAAKQAASAQATPPYKAFGAKAGSKGQPRHKGPKKDQQRGTKTQIVQQGGGRVGELLPNLLPPSAMPYMTPMDVGRLLVGVIDAAREGYIKE